MSRIVETIKERLSIVDVVGSYVQLQKAGKYFKAKSPFTNERTPSFYVSPDRNLYHCFSTGKGGDAFTFVQEMEGVDFKGALKILAERAGVELEPEDPKARSERDQLFAIMEEATRFYEEELARTPDALAYLAKRGLRPETAKEWRLGFAPEGWHDVSTRLRRVVKATDDELEKAGMAIKGQKGYYDRFRSRIMFPIFDGSGRVVGFSGRAFGKDAEERGPKYMNSPETALFDKSGVLYGWHKAKHGIHKMDYAILVEGQMDLLLSHQSGCSNTVASSGTALTERQLELVRRIAPRVVIAYDGDKAGIAASERAWELALSLGLDVKVAALPAGLDPADAIAKDPSIWRDALKGAMQAIEFKLASVLTAESDPRKRAMRITKEVVPHVARLANSLEQAHFVKRIYEATGYPEDVVWQEVRKVPKPAASTGAVPALTPTQAAQPSVLAVPQARAESASFVEAVKNAFALAYQQEGAADAVVDGKVLLERLRVILGATYEAYEAAHAATKDVLVFEAERRYSAAKPELLKREAEDLLTRIEIDHLQRQRADAMRSITAAGKESGDEQALLASYQDLSRRIDTLQASLSK